MPVNVPKIIFFLKEKHGCDTDVFTAMNCAELDLFNAIDGKVWRVLRVKMLRLSVSVPKVPVLVGLY